MSTTTVLAPHTLRMFAVEVRRNVRPTPFETDPDCRLKLTCSSVSHGHHRPFLTAVHRNFKWTSTSISFARRLPFYFDGHVRFKQTWSGFWKGRACPFQTSFWVRFKRPWTSDYFGRRPPNIFDVKYRYFVRSRPKNGSLLWKHVDMAGQFYLAFCIQTS